VSRPKKSRKSGEAFSKLLKEKGYSQYRLVQETGIDKSTISKIANGETASPKAENLEKIAEVLKVGIDELLKVFTQPTTFLESLTSDRIIQEELPQKILAKVNSIELSVPNQPTQLNFEDILATWATNADLVYSAPACAFLSGEHSVVFGHPAIYLPLPMRLYIKLEASSQIEGIIIEDFKCPNPREPINILSTELIDDYGRCSTDDQKKALMLLFWSIVKPFLKSELEKIGFRISVISSFPVAVGLNSSGALSACISKALIENFIDVESFKNYFELHDKHEREVAMLLAWSIENCFHGGRSSGAGATVSFSGRLGMHPIVYSISKRSYLFHRHLEGWNPVIVSESEKDFKSLSKIKKIVFDPGENFIDLPNYPDPPPYNVTILYSGAPSKTADVLKRNIRSPIKSSIERVKYVCQMFDQKFEDKSFQRSLAVHRYDIIEKIYLNTQLDNFDRSEQISYAYLELLSEGLGNISIGVFNSIVSDWNSVPDFMNAYQALLCGIGVSDLKTEGLIGKLKYASIEKQLQEDKLISHLGAKITGAGKGGDIIVFSLYEADEHKEIVARNKQDINTIHFSSCELSASQWNTSVEGVRRENF